jgi:hypothetical protein
MTYLNEKNAVANVLGKTDGATANTIRDNAINEVRQFDIANAYPFSWLERTTTLTTSATGTVDLPANFNVTHKPKDVREVLTNTNDDNVFKMVNKEIFDNYDAGDEVYYIDWNTSTEKWQIHTTEFSTGITIVYYCIPTTLTADADIDPIPDLTVIKYLAAARFWLTERNYGNYDRFNDMGMQRLQLLINKDKKANPQRLSRSTAYGVSQGWNESD